MRSREEVSCQWGQYFHIVSECEENVSSEETGITSFKTEKGQKDRWRKGDTVLGRKKAVFQYGSTNPSKTTNEFCWISKSVRRYNRLRGCLIVDQISSTMFQKEELNPNINAVFPIFSILQTL